MLPQLAVGRGMATVAAGELGHAGRAEWAEWAIGCHAWAVAAAEGGLMQLKRLLRNEQQ